MFRNFTRFSQFQKSLGIATNILAKRLEGFVAAGLMERQPGPGEQPEYLLTQKGLELKPVIIGRTAMSQIKNAPDTPFSLGKCTMQRLDSWLASHQGWKQR